MQGDAGYQDVLDCAGSLAKVCMFFHGQVSLKYKPFLPLSTPHTDDWLFAVQYYECNSYEREMIKLLVVNPQIVKVHGAINTNTLQGIDLHLFVERA